MRLVTAEIRDPDGLDQALDPAGPVVAGGMTG
jgi:hypothetical protein